MTIDYNNTYCVNHPDRQTLLRCNRCDRPICIQCAVRTPTGYRCKDCVRGQQRVFDTANWSDYPIAFGIAAVIGFAGSWTATFLSFFTILLAPVIGVLAAETVRWAIKKRRSPTLYKLAAAGVALGSLPLLAINAIGILLLLTGGGSLASLLSLLWQALFTFLATSSAYYRLSGIQIR
ncbi:MAG TPA: B-box zinc finger protein [Anaerolineaceae bacterium]